MTTRTSSGAITGLLLAAGQGSRFHAATNRNKLTEPIPEGLPGAGMPVALAALAALRDAVPDIVAVTARDNADLIGLLEGAGCKVLRVSSGGTGESIALGVRARPGAAGWLVALADMPFIKPSTIRAIAGALTPNGTAAPAFRGQRGHPVGFGAGHGAALMALTGDEGARAILKAHPPRLVEVDDRGVLLDIDRPEDWTAARAGRI